MYILWFIGLVVERFSFWEWEVPSSISGWALARSCSLYLDGKFSSNCIAITCRIATRPDRTRTGPKWCNWYNLFLNLALWFFVFGDVFGHHVDFRNGGRRHCGLMLILRFSYTWWVASYFYNLTGNRVEVVLKLLCWNTNGSQLTITVVANKLDRRWLYFFVITGGTHCYCDWFPVWFSIMNIPYDI
jgi:hypothetical protein